MLRYYTLSLLFLLFGFSLIAQDCQLNPPKGLFISDLTTCSATLHWKSNANVKKYSVSYKLSSSTQWSAAVGVGKDTLYTFTGLSADKKYDFGVRAKCSDGSTSPQKQKSAKTVACMLPDFVSIVANNSSSVKITVQTSCPYKAVHIRYSTLTGSPVIKTFPFAASYQINGLDFKETYLFEVSTCKLSFNTWTSIDTVSLPKPPNIVLVLVDDSRADYFSCNGAFPFIHTPNIDRIADEGVNFKSTYVATSLCAPSRATIATGLFTIKTGVTDNIYHLDTSFVTIPEVLGDHGYYTAMIGKNHHTFIENGDIEFDYYLLNIERETGTHFDYNGNEVEIDKPGVLTVSDSAIGLIEKIDDPLFLWLAYMEPHSPYTPIPSFDGIYQNQIIPWKADTAQYKVNYPSFLYGGAQSLLHGEDLDTTYRTLMEVMAGLDSSVGEVINALETSGKLDNTLLIFMSDNGFMIGSHWLDGKTLAYEPSMKIPLFIRYPEWFTPNSVITDQFASNMDIAPTIYQAAGINYTDPLDGKSLKALYDGNFSRSAVYYYMVHAPNSNGVAKRAIRDKHYKYIHYGCNPDTVEEFFDMVNDPLELTNLINNHLYDSLVQVYRVKYDSMKVAWQDTATGNIKSCYIKNPFVLKELVESEEYLPEQPKIYPTITKNFVDIYIPWNSAVATLSNSFGQPVQSWLISETYSHIEFTLPSGVYYLNISGNARSVSEKLIVIK